ncbi:hypothetical protein ACSEOC_00850 [Pseudomonas aeruginosa]|nr:hypothetical protein [Pseudomonas aeruginosa]
MERFTEAIIQSVDSGIWFGALSLSLMLPDVCASLETPKAQNGERYRRWFRKWLQPRYTINIPVVGEQVFFSAENAWKLRNSFLHAGNGEIKQTADALRKFHFTEPPGNGNIVHLNIINDVLQLQIDKFCEEVVGAVMDWNESCSNDQEIQSRKTLLLGVHSIYK